MGELYLAPPSRAVAMVISRTRVHSRFSKKNEPTTRVCTARSSTLVGTQLWRTQTRTCQCRLEENLFPRPCITLCDSVAPTECMPAICQAIQRRMAAFGCRNSTQLHSSMQSMLALRLRFTEGRQAVVTWDNCGRHSLGALVHLEVRVSIRDFFRLRHLGGSDKVNRGNDGRRRQLHCRRSATSEAAKR